MGPIIFGYCALEWHNQDESFRPTRWFARKARGKLGFGSSKQLRIWNTIDSRELQYIKGMITKKFSCIQAQASVSLHRTFVFCHHMGGGDKLAS